MFPSVYLIQKQGSSCNSYLSVYLSHKIYTNQIVVLHVHKISVFDVLSAILLFTIEVVLGIL